MLNYSWLAILLRAYLREKRRITQIVFLELKVKDKTLASYKLKEEFEPLENRHTIPYGGPGGTPFNNI